MDWGIRCGAAGQSRVVDSAQHSDLVIVGAGIAGLAHAVAAVKRGLSVTVVERDNRAVGASVRNFGHACVTAQSGELLELAQTARGIWLETAAAAGFWARPTGGVAVARSAAELAVLEELSAAREEGQVRMLDAAEVRAALGGTADAAVVGGAALRDDVRVDPREAVAAIAAWLETRGVRFLWRTSYLGTDGDRVRTSRGELRADRTVVCVGHDLDLLQPELADAHEVRRCALQMALVRPPDERRIEPAVLTGTSMLRYPAFAETAAAAALRVEVGETAPELVAIGANVMFTQRPDGTLLVGDSHAYDLTHGPFLDEGWSTTLLDAVARVLGVQSLDVIQRWQGVYASSDRQPFLIAPLDDTTTAVSITSGVGMTISFGVAERTFTGLGMPLPVTAS
jgi:D-hydroxyproline dehydrogenase subunit beta